MKITGNKTFVELDGRSYEVKISDVDVLIATKDIRKRALELRFGDHEGIKAYLEWVVDKINEALGNGAAVDIFGDEPVSIGKALNVYNAICTASIKAHMDYVAKTYGV